MDDKDFLAKRLKELYNRAYMNSYSVFSDFLNMEEQSVLASLNLPCVTYGGYDMAERVVAGFGDYIDEYSFPIKCICISSVSQKFADKLTHRDFLGSLMNLGIKRELLGDIVIKDNCGYLLCLEQISDYIVENLTRIKHTSVKAQVLDSIPELLNIEPDETNIIVSSRRADVLIAAVYKLSRSEASRLFQSGKVFINSKQTENTSYSLKDNDIVSVRGFGRFAMSSDIRTTKKDRLVVSIKIYR